MSAFSISFRVRVIDSMDSSSLTPMLRADGM